MYSLAFLQGLTKGRPVVRVCAVCLYVALRKEQTPVMLIELADLVQVSVFKLGTLFMLFRREFPSVAGVDDIDPSIYIARFAGTLGFGDKTREVANDALKLVTRMKRDWIADGRRPAGICGAALLIAARMHHFHRSVKEIVYLVKMSDITVKTRLREFERTPAAQLSAAQFRDSFDSPEVLNSLPPSFLRNRMAEIESQSKGAECNGEIKLRGLREGSRMCDETDIELSSEDETLANEIRSHAEAMIVAATKHITLPLTPPSTCEVSPSENPLPSGKDFDKGNELKPSAKKVKRRTLTAKEHREMLENLSQKLPFNAATTGEYAISPDAGNMPIAATTANLTDILPVSKLREQNEQRLKSSAELEGVAESSLPDPDRGRVHLTAEDMHLSDLDEDEEVAGVVVSPEEAVIRAAIWHELNREYLSEQLEKQRLKSLQVPGSGKGRKRKNRTENGGHLDGNGNPPANAAEALSRMATRKISSKVNKDHLEALFKSSLPGSPLLGSEMTDSSKLVANDKSNMQESGDYDDYEEEEVAVPLDLYTVEEEEEEYD
jgi:hypothetical protein